MFGLSGPGTSRPHRPVRNPQNGLDRYRLASAQDVQGNRPVRSAQADLKAKGRRIRDFHAIHRNNNVAWLQAYRLGGAARHDLRDQRAAGRVQVKRACDIGRHILNDDAQLTALHLPVAHKLIRDRHRHINRNGKPDASRSL